MRQKRTKNRNTRRRNTKKKNTKRRNTRKRNTRKKTKRSMRGGMRALRCVGCGPPPVAPVAPTVTAVATMSLPIIHSLVDKFFTVESGDGGDEYKLKGDLQLISAHGGVLPTYTVVPEGITLYLIVRAGLSATNHPESARIAGTYAYLSVDRKNEDNYISVYGPGSLIQGHVLNFNPLYSDVTPRSEINAKRPNRFTPRGLLKWKLRKGGRDYKDGFMCAHDDEDCLKKAMDYLSDACSDNLRILDLQKNCW